MKILVCDDHALFRAGLTAALRDLSVETEVLEAADSDAAMAAIDEHEIDLLLLDLQLPGVDGWSTLRALRASHPTLPVVIVSASEDPADVRAALDAGASGFIPKNSPTPVMLAALEVVFSGGVYIPPEILAGGDSAGSGTAGAAGQSPRPKRTRVNGLTARQREVMILMSRGLTNPEIGDALGIAKGTVKAHVAAVLDALDASNRTEATLIMQELDLESDDGASGA